jgi:hypothetical protein
MCCVNQCLTLIIGIFPVGILIVCLEEMNIVDTVHAKFPHIPQV